MIAPLHLASHLERYVIMRIFKKRKAIGDKSILIIDNKLAGKLF